MQKVHKGEAKLAEIIPTYDDEMQKRGKAEVLTSRKNAYMLLDWDQLMDSPIMTRSLEKAVATDG